MDGRWWLGAALGVAGCSPAVSVDTDSASGTDTETDTDTEDPSETLTDPTATETAGPDVPPPVCPTVPLSAPPAMVSGTTVGAEDHAMPSCSTGNGPDALVDFTAPGTGVFVFSTAGSAIDTILYALDESCLGGELACNDDTVDMTSALSLPLMVGQRVTLVVDTFEVPGEWVLSVTQAGSGACPDDNLGMTAAPWTRAGNTMGGTAQFGSDCGGADAPERSFTWLAPEDGTYAFDTVGSSLDTVLYVLDGSCDGPVLQCSNDIEYGTASGVVEDLVAGQAVTVVVDGITGVGGEYTLTVDRIASACVETQLGAVPPVAVPGDTTSATNTGGSSCGGMFAPDRRYRWQPDAPGFYEFRVDADFPAVLDARASGCGEELRCMSGPGQTSGAFDLALDGLEPVDIRVDGQGHATGAFTLSISPTFCPQGNLGQVANVMRFGTNVGESDTLEPSCAPGGADLTWWWTAPADGNYQISTVGSDFDTVLAVFNATCDGVELACDDDGGGDGQSVITLPAMAGQTYVILLDGFGGATGNYELTISPA